MQLVCVCVWVCTCVLVHVQVTWIQLYVLGRGVKKHWFIHSLAIFCCHRVVNEFAMLRQKSRTMLTVNIADRPHILRYFLMHWLSHLHSFCLFVISYIWGIGALLWFTLIKSNSETGHLFSRRPASTVLNSCDWQNFLTFFFNPLQSVEFTKKMLNTSFSWVCN